MNKQKLHDYQVPEHLHGGLIRYVENRIPPGSFLMAVLQNDLMGAFGKADEISRAGLFELCTFIWNEVPAAAWGSEKKVLAWIEARQAVAP